jgi:hypothetical protein
MILRAEFLGPRSPQLTTNRISNQVSHLASAGMLFADVEECYEILGYCWPRWKKWTYLAAVAFVQVSMNFNTRCHWQMTIYSRCEQLELLGALG